VAKKEHSEAVKKAIGDIEAAMAHMSNEMFQMLMDHVTRFAQGILPLPIQQFVIQANNEVDIMQTVEAPEIKAHEEKLVMYRELAEAALAYQDAVKNIVPSELETEIHEAWKKATSMELQTNAPTSDEVQ